MSRARVLVIDDDRSITGFLKRALSYAGFDVDLAHSGPEGLERALLFRPEVVVLDILMPGMDGLEVCRRLRAADDTPILMLTAKDEVSDRVEGLESGADDYLVKPFAHEELIARVRALLRRSGREEDRKNVVRFADLTVDLAAREVRRADRPVHLTAREFDLLAAFLRHPRQVLSQEQLLEQVWGIDFEAHTHVVAVYVGYLREKLEAGGEPRLIHTMRGAGYVLREEERPHDGETPGPAPAR
ncbi:MAG: response regulator transcription factor [Rubrobacteraceae bacterium]|uniref:response regulator transcription factor n=1 Tax=Rubrobacter naiadicus TaxID=1392641 RepID=UPI002360704F|nr:response regulator transcription factor [Rubrobacter naiadicus]MBX6763948.1 response regulator transcription factor [Rubrobacteraceae bacterium]MCL6437356.1 response regulator transcription factor [Rubrobacteraceae bacterium]